MEFLAPAKVNLTLRVSRRRDDSFHEIESLIAPISIHDTLDIERRETGGLAFTCGDPTIPANGTNLVVHAVELFCGSFGLQPHLRIHLQKEIPHGAGLGGGSSDAATTLIALNHLFRTELPPEELMKLAGELGSDIPFFFVQGAAWCRGRGEIVEPASLPSSLPILLVKPPFAVPTPWAYQQWHDSLEIPGVDYSAQKMPWGELVNDLERPVFQKYFQLPEWKRWLRAQPEVAGALMSGSGSTMFAVLRSKEAGMSLAERFAAEFGQNLWFGLTETV